MNILKFRAWDGQKMVSPDYITREGIAYWHEDGVLCSSELVMQYTGLKDKNGKEGYEGDIIGFYDFISEPKYKKAISEIENAMERKAKENGQKVIIKFE